MKRITFSSIVVIIQFPWIILGRNFLFIRGMIKLGSKNFPVTCLKSTNYLNLASCCVSRKLISLSHLNPRSLGHKLQEDGQICAILSSIWPLECPKKLKNLHYSIERVTTSNFSWTIIYTFRFVASVGYY